MIELGGNKITKLNRKIKKTSIGNSKYYFYNHYNLQKNEKITLPKNINCTVFILNCKKDSVIKFDNKKIKIRKFSCIYFKKYEKLEVLNSSIEILLVGKKLSNIKNFILNKKYFNFYKVSKPWGYELWINSLNTDFAFKKIYIKKGFQTSLQFHNYKRETNLVLDGVARFFYKKNKKVKNIDVTTKDIGFKNLKKNTIVNVYPKILHRIKALKNLTLYEVSSPHLKDVVRVKDDSKRISGHLSSEHP
jgi:mannose-6-phosphate isomerase-like protein (cupin superfamily)